MEFPYAIHPASPNNNIYNLGTFITTKKTFIHYYQPN